MSDFWLTLPENYSLAWGVKTCLQAGEASWPVWDSGLSHGTHSQEAGNEQEVEWGYKVSSSSIDLFSPARILAYEGSTTSGTASPAGNK